MPFCMHSQINAGLLITLSIAVRGLETLLALKYDRALIRIIIRHALANR